MTVIATIKDLRVSSSVVAIKRPKELHWEVFVGDRKIGSFWHGCGSFWWNILPDLVGQKIPENIIETNDRAIYVHDKCAQWVFKKND
jgi:hypothetical protein